VEQGRADPLPFLEAIERHDLQLVPSDMKCEQPDRHAIADRKEAWQPVGMV
jgi:hypothetical protein